MIELVFEDLCTGCNACVAVCPTHVFDAGAAGPPVIARPDQCQTCFMCELYCDADALYVGADQRVIEGADPQTVRASGQLGRLRHEYGWDEPAAQPQTKSEFWRLGPLLMEGAQIAARRYALKHPEPARPAPLAERPAVGAAE